MKKKTIYLVEIGYGDVSYTFQMVLAAYESEAKAKEFVEKAQKWFDEHSAIAWATTNWLAERQYLKDNPSPYDEWLNSYESFPKDDYRYVYYAVELNCE